PGERIHILGIAGAGASAAALLAKAAGAVVTGCDPGGPSPYTRALEAARIPIEWSHNPAHVGVTPPPDRLAVTKALTAISPDHPELQAARAAGIPVGSWQQVVSDAASGRAVAAVAGTHGKSTTAGWLTWLLAETGEDPSAFVGALLPASLTGGVPATARLGQGTPFVIEADEYAGNFDPYRPSVAIVTTVEWDHPDVFADRAAVIEAFAAWLERVPAATIVANLDDAGVRELLAHLERRGTRTGPVTGYSTGSGAVPAAAGAAMRSIGAGANAPAAAAPSVVVDEQISAEIVERTPAGTIVDIEGVADGSRRVHLPTVGDHNVGNALAALGAARALAGGGDPDRRTDADRLLWALGSFPGIGRRLERKGEARGVAVYDDYGHHPTAIRATLAAIREREPGRRIWAVYEPLTFHRTAAMLDAFADALAEADAVAIADIWASRDPDTLITSPGALAAAVRTRRPGMTAFAPGSVEATAAWLAREVRDGDAVLVMGGGRSYRIAELLLETLQGS
ncbi:MAG TPA: Mur ligase family protein, partial [Candidatus Limnocylindrales bacterium]|nr:Mur ligase family protein [Candidatus Limnocylindrales bacterium]